MSQSDDNRYNEDKKRFREAMKGVTPLKGDATVRPAKKHRQPPKRAEINDDPTPTRRLAPKFSSNDWLSGEDSIHFAKAGVQGKVIRRLSQGKVAIEATIDLHRQTVDEAMNSVDNFINRCVAQGKRCIRIVHGKGHFSQDGKPILKNFLFHWLREHPSVVAFHSAKARDGGSGALYVMLKKSRSL